MKAFLVFFPIPPFVSLENPLSWLGRRSRVWWMRRRRFRWTRGGRHDGARRRRFGGAGRRRLRGPGRRRLGGSGLDGGGEGGVRLPPPLTRMFSPRFHHGATHTRRCSAKTSSTTPASWAPGVYQVSFSHLSSPYVFV